MAFTFNSAAKTALQVTALGDLEALNLTPATQSSLAKLQEQQARAVFIAGAGCVGLATALALLKQGYTVVLHDPQALTPWSAEQRDVKIFAVNHVNASYLDSLGAWDYIKALRVNAYDTLSLYAEQQPETFFTAQEVDIQELGYMVENAALVQGLLQACQAYENFIFLSQIQVTNAQRLNLAGEFNVSEQYKPLASQHAWHITFNTGLSLVTNLVLAADGANSYWRQQANIGVDTHSYPTKCLLIQVETDAAVTSKYAHHTWQYIDEHGPKAWLPESENTGVLCWYDQIETIDALQQMPLARLTTQVLQKFPSDRVGTELKVLQAVSFPLARKRAKHYWQNNVLLLGDAAHTVSPLAGQGLNLGLQDVQCLDLLFANRDFKSLEALALAYARERFTDNTAMQEFLSFLHHTYVSQLGIFKMIKPNLYRILSITPLKHEALNYANGDRSVHRSVFTILNKLSNFLANSRTKSGKDEAGL
ncbi:FAD-dependent monooxygenase [Psittacicella hinzii]|uniref:FAD-binding domain-containing protein n=1 Tax=Psittacicella hinzii TaxID=2028575 RepID=A0A3A1YT32_9GAMM|nr:FAD-dependent monooxygenase [Psittacicella hinzii]RIY39197.1 hypothetical protein CKF58_02705 [Psittacicella hinzii]